MVCMYSLCSFHEDIWRIPDRIYADFGYYIIPDTGSGSCDDCCIFEICLVANDYLPPQPLLLMTVTEIIFIVPWVVLVRKAYTRLYPPRQMLVIYGNYSPDDLIAKINTRKDKYNICAAESYRIGYESCIR